MDLQAAAEMFVMVLDVHKWVAMPAVAARARQAGVSAGTGIPSELSPSLQLLEQPENPILSLQFTCHHQTAPPKISEGLSLHNYKDMSTV